MPRGYFDKPTTRNCRTCSSTFTTQNAGSWYCNEQCRVEGRAKSQQFGKIKHRYDLTKEEYEELLKKQNHRCAICKADKPLPDNQKAKTWFVDHDHVTGKVRGLLCRLCNWGLGSFKDDPKSLQAAIDYLVGVHRMN